jgi:hypothetical protein
LARLDFFARHDGGMTVGPESALAGGASLAFGEMLLAWSG